MIKRLIVEIQKLELDLNLGDRAFCVFDTDEDELKDKDV